MIQTFRINRLMLFHALSANILVLIQVLPIFVYNNQLALLIH